MSVQSLTSALSIHFDTKYGVYRYNYEGGQTTFKFKPLSDSLVLLHSLRSDPIGMGQGTATLYDLCKMFDAHQVSCRLTPNPGSGSKMKLSKLREWYVKFGFEPDKALQIYTRLPRETLQMSGLINPMEVSATFTIQWKAIDKNPTKYADDWTISQLVTVLKKATDYYFNKQPKLSDRSFDILETKLRERSPNNKYFASVGATPIKGKVALPYKMPSLNKIRPDMGILDGWIEENEGPYVLSDKLDGNSILFDGSDPKNPRLYTRGDGSRGQDVTHLLKYVKVPKIGKPLVARGEMILPKGMFDRLVKKADNPESFNLRNFLAGQINRKNVDTPDMVHAKLVLYEMIEPQMQPSKQLGTLKALGFDVVAYKLVKTINTELLSKVLKDRKTKSPYDIDGLVVSQDKKHRRSDTNPTWSFAFKEQLEQDIKQVKVLEIEWNVSRHGLIKPVILIEPTRMSGVMVQRVTGHNAKVIKDGKIGPGALIRVIRSGEVIPTLISVVKGTKAQMPDMDYEWGETGVDIYAIGEDDGTIETQSIAHFFTTIGVEGLRLGTVNKLYYDGLDTVQKIIKATPARLVKVEGLQEKSATKIVGGIKSALAKATLPQLMDASMTFGAGLGTRMSRLVVETYPDLLDWKVGGKVSPKVYESYVDQVLEVPGFSEKRARQFVDGLAQFIPFYKSLGIKVAISAPKVKASGSKMKNQFVVATGFRDKDAFAWIEQQGGTVGDSMTRATMLLVKDKTSTSSKMLTAKSKGIPIYTFDEWSKKFGYKG